MLSLHYSITKDDYINYYTYVMWDAPDKKKKHIIYYLQQLVTNVIIIAVLLYSDVFYSRPSLLYIYIAILLFIVALQIFSGRSRTKKQAEKIIADPYNASIFYEMKLQVSETGIYKKDAVKETRYTWNAFIKKLENEDYYFLFVNKIDALIVPKKVFKTTNEKASFEQLLVTYLSLDAEIAHLL